MLSITLGERLRRGIEDDILAGHLTPGDLIDERALAERHGISRTPIREALLQLATLGLVSMRPRMPTRVATISAPALMHMTEVMCCLEAEAARLAARRMKPQQRKELQALQARAVTAVEARDTATFNEINWDLHLAIFTGSQNGYLAAQARQLRLRLHPYRCFLVRIGDRVARAHEQHQTLVQAIVDGDGDRAFEAMRCHLRLDSEQFTDLISLLPAAGGDEDEAPIELAAGVGAK